MSLNLGTILLFILIVLLILSVPNVGLNRWGWSPVAIILVTVIVVWALGGLPGIHLR